MRCTALLVLALLAAPAARAFDLADLMMRLAARGDAAASFTEEQHLATLDRPLRSSGELRYRASGELEKRTLAPRAETLRYADGIAWSERGARTRRLDLSRYPQVLPLVESIRATLAGDAQALTQRFEVELDGHASAWRLQLRPREAQARALIRVIDIEGRDADVTRLVLERPNGDRTVTTLMPHAP